MLMGPAARELAAGNKYHSRLAGECPGDAEQAEDEAPSTNRKCPKAHR